jgi:acetylornithine/succinyldiaminopimelate/putrescine aminotransferase
MSKKESHITFITAKDEQVSQGILKGFYQNKFIPAEKKPYLTDLKNSTGPYLACKSEDGPHYIQDAASQIATLGLGFNAPVFMGVAQHLEAWTNNSSTCEFKKVREAMESFFGRALGWQNLNLTLVNSGAEANETALGYAYLTRKNKAASKVLAFEGSFHGRMMVTLMSTWNKSKREPFEWNEFSTVYCPFPELAGDIVEQKFPKNWRADWENSAKKNFSYSAKSNDTELKLEIECLLKVREELLTGKIFSVIIEPMQCEGGDRFCSDRFNNALIAMTHAFGVSLIYDEVQTGYHLGREFFWHREFKLENSRGEKITPDFVTSAKKAQLGIVFSHENFHKHYENEEFSVASAIRGLNHAVALWQKSQDIIKLEKMVRPMVEKIVKKYSAHLERPRVRGVCFAIDVKDVNQLNPFVAQRFAFGLMFYPAGDKTLRFRLNLGYNKSDLDFLFSSLDNIIQTLFLKKEVKPTPTIAHRLAHNTKYYAWHEYLIALKTKMYGGKKVSSSNVLKDVTDLMPEDFSLIEINKKNYKKYRTHITKLQKRNYEPARQTEIEKFDAAINSVNSHCLGLIFKKALVGITFAAPLSQFPFERGVRRDPNFADKKSLYVIDTTIDKTHQGKNLGRDLKYALTAFALSRGMDRINGRNRDRLASHMLNINLSLGAFEQLYIPEDYPDNEAHRDVFYYTSPLHWTKSPLKLATRINSPTSELNEEFIARNFPVMVNKMTLSNFVDANFLQDFKFIASQFPVSMRHCYSASGQSECVDKIAKTVWYKDKKSNRMLTFDHHYFGNGSFLARSLSQKNDHYFPVDHLPNPASESPDKVLKLVEEHLKKEKYLGVWIEPILQKTLEKVPVSFLKQLKKLCHEYKTPLIYNETAAINFHYEADQFSPSHNPEIAPDLAMSFLGGQAGIVYMIEDYFLDKPLMLISTWDGDAYSYAHFAESLRMITESYQKYLLTRQLFQEKIVSILKDYEITDFQLENGQGWVKGHFPKVLKDMLGVAPDRYTICPSLCAMKRFLEEF